MKKFIKVFLILGLCFSSLFSQTNKNQIVTAKEHSDMFKLTDEIIQQRIEMFLLKNYKENHKEVVITCDKMPTPIPVERVDWEIKVDSKYKGVKNGTNLVEVTVFSRDEIYKKFNVYAKLQTFDDIVVAAKMLQKGQKFTEADLSLETIETTTLKRDYFTSLEELLDLQTKQLISKDKPIYTSMVELPDIIHRGDVIKIVVKLKNMEVTATGKALQDGKRGEMIKVQNQSTGKKLTAEILNNKTVLVEL
jgi:flagella basal body P-ring formation protein FlgA